MSPGPWSSLSILLLASWGLASLVGVLPVGAPLRRALHWIPGLGTLARCPACLGFWVGLALSLWGPAPVQAPGVVGALWAGLAASGACWLVHATLGQAPWRRERDPRPAFAAALDFALAARDPAQLAELCHQSGLAHLRLLDPHGALPLLQRALALWTREGIAPEEAIAARINIAVAHWRAGAARAAADDLSAMLAEGSLVESERAALLASLGLALAAAGEEAEPALAEALELARRGGDHAELLRTARVAAEARLAQGDPEAAKVDLDEARAALRAMAAEGISVDPADLVALGVSLWRVGAASHGTIAVALRALPAALADPDTAWELADLRAAVADLPPDPKDLRAAAGSRLLKQEGNPLYTAI